MQILGKGMIVIGLGLVVGMATPRLASAQQFSTADPAPLLNGTTKGKTVYTVPHLINDPGEVAFCVACTSTIKSGGKNFLFGVEIIDNGTQLDNDVATGKGVASLTPGDTDIICTQATGHFVGEDVTIGNPQVDHGSARIISESNRIICAAYILDPVGLNPAHFAVLPMFKGTSQKGD